MDWTTLPCVLAMVFHLLVASTTLQAQLKPAPIFTDDMVIQRDRPLNIWGSAPAGSAVTVQFAGNSADTVADAQGKWALKLAPPAMNASPQELRISGSGTAITLRNILVGDVWFCAGQSNMAFALRDATGGDRDIEDAASLKPVRWIAMPNRAAIDPLAEMDNKGERIRWRLASSRSVGELSAVAFYFAREVHAHTGVPLGLVTAAWGGTPIEAWIPRENLLGLPNASAIEAARQKTLEQMRANPTAFPYGPEIMLHTSPSACFNGMVRPIASMSMRGILWYQGEQNAGSGLDRYTPAMKALIESWRITFGNSDLPFFYVQLPNYEDRHEGSWPLTREAQQFALHVPHTGMAISIDQGDARNIHPRNKVEIGRRLARLALTRAYGHPGPSTGPLYQSMAIEGSCIRISFVQTGTGLVSMGARQDAVSEFEIAGSDRKFFPAKALIDGTTVVVSAESVAHPVAVRYAWKNAPSVNLFNKEGLPASPFRTDNWPERDRTSWTVPDDWNH